MRGFGNEGMRCGENPGNGRTVAKEGEKGRNKLSGNAVCGAGETAGKSRAEGGGEGEVGKGELRETAGQLP